MNRLGTFLHIRANLPNIIISPSVFLKKGTSVGRHSLTCKVGVIAVCKNKINTESRRTERKDLYSCFNQVIYSFFYM